MRRFPFILGVFAILAGCKGPTGVAAVDDVTGATQQCESQFTVTNSSSHDINIHMNVGEAEAEAECRSINDNQSLTVPAGQTATVKGDLHCQTCWVYSNYSVDSTDPKVTYQGDHTDNNSASIQNSAICTDSGCSGT